MLCSDDLRWTPWTLYDTKNIIKQALVKFELWMMWMSDLLPILLVFRGWSMQHEHNEGLFWLPTKDNLTSEWLPKVCMCCHWPPKNHQKPAARQTQWNTKILAVLIVWTSRKWPERDLDTLRRLPPAEWSHDGHQNRAEAAIVLDCHRLIANGVFIILKGGYYASLAQRGKRIEFPGQDTSIWSFLLHLQPDTSRDSAESPSHDFPDVVYLKIFETPSGLAILWRHPVLTLPHARATKCLSSFVEAIGHFHYIGIYSCDILRLCKYIIPYIYIYHIYRYIPYIYTILYRFFTGFLTCLGSAMAMMAMMAMTPRVSPWLFRYGLVIDKNKIK